MNEHTLRDRARRHGLVIEQRPLPANCVPLRGGFKLVDPVTRVAVCGGGRSGRRYEAILETIAFCLDGMDRGMDWEQARGEG